jgi:thiol-disulfide isomerase/thioredoxin
MMKLKFILVVLGIGITLKPVYAQNSRTALKIGDKVPDIEFKMLNHSSKSTKLSDYRGKVVILDFWTTFCTPCVAKFPQLDSLQKANSDLVKILLVNQDDLSKNPDRVNVFLAKYLKKT